MSSNDITTEKTCSDSQTIGKGKIVIGYLLTGNCNIYVNPFHSAKVRCVVDQPIIRDKADHIIFHVGTNDIPFGKDAGDIVKLIVDLAMSIKSQTCDVSISNIITTKDRHQHKAQIVNNHLK